MLVVAAERLVEGDGGERSGIDVVEEIGLILEMLALGLAAVGEVLEVGEGLMVVLECVVGIAGERRVPAARIPRP